MRFPSYRTSDLNGQRVAVPDDFAGELNLCFAAYERWQQREVDSWVPWAADRERAIPTFRYYELPVVGRFGPVRRASLDFFMRQGIPDPADRGRTLTLYEDIDEFRAALGIETPDTIALILVDGGGQVLWTGLGAFDPANAQQIIAVAKHQGLDLNLPA